MGGLARQHDIAQRFSRAAAHYSNYADLQAAIAEVLLKEAVPSGVVVDAGCGRGRDTHRLAQLADVEYVLALDLSPAMLQAVPISERIYPLCADVENLPLATASVNTVVSNFALQWCQSPPHVAAEIARVLIKQGRLYASMPGPGSLAALHRSGFLINQFTEAAEWQAAFLTAGFQAVNVRQQSFVLHFREARSLLKALQGIGAGSVDRQRANHLKGTMWWKNACTALESEREAEGIPLRYHVIFIEATR
jgi:malonyl-CoA O-methyltransferase